MILADEPTAHLDYIQVEGILQLVRELADDGRLVVVATHDDRLIPFADRVVNLTPAPTPVPRTGRVELAAGDVLFSQGERGDLVYVVEDGTIDIGGCATTARKRTWPRSTPGNYFGELAPMFGLQRSATACAAVP